MPRRRTGCRIHFDDVDIRVGDVRGTGPAGVVGIEVRGDAVLAELAQPDVVHQEDVGLVADRSVLAQQKPLVLRVVGHARQLDGHVRMVGLELVLRAKNGDGPSEAGSCTV